MDPALHAVCWSFVEGFERHVIQSFSGVPPADSHPLEGWLEAHRVFLSVNLSWATVRRLLPGPEQDAFPDARTWMTTLLVHTLDLYVASCVAVRTVPLMKTASQRLPNILPVPTAIQ